MSLFSRRNCRGSNRRALKEGLSNGAEHDATTLSGAVLGEPNPCGSSLVRNPYWPEFCHPRWLSLDELYSPQCRQ